MGSDLSPNEEMKLRSRLDTLLRTDIENFYVESAQKLLGDYQPSVFSGFNKFNPDKVREAVVFVCNQIDMLSKTKLMKMLFYSDFLYFKENSISISGLRYAHLPFGPAVHGWSTLLAWLEQEKVIELSPTEQDCDLITSSQVLQGELNESELKTLERVISKLGKLSARDLSDLTHLEKAYKETKKGDLISYEYALELKF